MVDRIQNQFGSALRETFSTLHYPTGPRLMAADFPMEFTANKYDGEDQIIRTLEGKMKYTDDVSGDRFRKKVEARLFTQKSMPWAEIKRRAATNPAWQWHRPDALDKAKQDFTHQDIWREDGAYVEKGPFPKPETQVKLQELSRDDETGTVKLRATPSNGDTVYVEVGGPATTASQRLSGRDYETNELEVSFLAVDSNGVHEAGDPQSWYNKITLKRRVYDDGPNKMLELRAAPPAAIKYSTDGSDPKLAGGAYDEPVVIPKGTRIVLAYAEKNGIASDVAQVTINWSKDPERKPIDKAKPATWKPADGFSYSTTRNAYGFITRLTKYGVEAAVTRIAVLDAKWVELSLADDIVMDADRLKATVEHLRSLVDAGEVNVDAAALRFPTGQALLDYVRDLAIELPHDDIEQD